jgi:protein-disulfide isomerase
MTINRKVIFLAIILLALSSTARAQTATAPVRPAQPPPAQSEQEELRKEIRALKDGQDQIRKELQDIKRLLLAREAAPARPAPPERVNIGALPTRGNQNARIVVVEFSDFQCPFCGRFYRDALPQIDENYIKTGKIKYAFGHVPLEQLHPNAFKAAEAAECAGEQGKFWQMHDRLFANQGLLAPAALNAHAKALELDLTKFSQCLDTGRSAATVRKNLAQAEEIGVDGTPTFVVGLVDAKSDGNMKVLSIISGAQPFSVFKTVIDKALSLNQ